MSDNVIALNGNAPPGKPVPDVVDMLAGLLIRAQKGEITAIAIAQRDGAGNLTSAWAGNGGTATDLLASITLLQHRFAGDMLKCGCMDPE